MPEAPPFKVCARAPLRVDLAGGGTDIPAFADAQGAAAVAAALSRSVHVEVRVGGGSIRLRAEDRNRHVNLRSPSGLVYDGTLDSPKAALNMLPVTGGIEILTRSDAPPGAGLGERGALNVALLAALSHCRNEALDPTELAELAFQLETTELRRLAGRQDPYNAALGGVHHLAFNADTVTARALVLEEGRLADLSAHLVIAYRGAHGADSAAHRTMEAIAAGESATVDALMGLRDLAAAMAEVVEHGDWRGVGRLFDEAARHHAMLDPLWSAPPTRAMVDAVRQAGAWGVKPGGPRAGASLAILAPRERRDAVLNAVRSHGGVALEGTVGAPGVGVWREDLQEA